MNYWLSADKECHLLLIENKTAQQRRITPPQEVSITRWGNTKINLILIIKRTSAPEPGISARREAQEKQENG